MKNEIIDHWICTDCLILLANGETDPNLTEEKTEEYLNRVCLEGYCLGDSENDLEFDKAPCESCGSPLAGSRHHACTLTPITSNTQMLCASGEHEFINQYIITAFWASHDDDGDDFDESEIEDLERETMEKIVKECLEFIKKARETVEDYDDLEESTCGHDFFLTRNGHGAGFWDGDYEEEIGKKLTELSEAFSESNPYFGDDGKIYFA
jgi:hypothetical protein